MIRIHVPEDEERISRFIEKCLRGEGFVSTVVADGVTAGDYAFKGQFHLLLDVGLPRLDGFAVLTVLRKGDLRIPVIILSVRGSAVNTGARLDGGAEDDIVKPFRFEELVERTRRRIRAGETHHPAEHIICILELNLHTQVRIRDRGYESDGKSHVVDGYVRQFRQENGTDRIVSMRPGISAS